MAKMILVFLIVFALVFAGMETFRSMTQGERWSLTKSVGYSIIIAVVTLILLAGFVILF
jgi:hypothetical protein